MTNNKKHILFTYTEHTISSTVSLMKRLLSMFPTNQFEPHLLKLTAENPGRQFQDYLNPIRNNLYLHFNFDCLGFNFSSYDDSPFFNTLWTPCATYLTIPAADLDAVLRREMNLNITLLCMTKKEENYIRRHYPDYDDVRTIVNPLQSIQPLYTTLLSLANRYPLRQ